MLPHLTDRQLRDIRALEEVLAAPQAAHSIEAWIAEIHEGVTDLFGVGRSTVILPLGPDEVRIDSPNVDSEILRGLKAALLGTLARTNRYRDPALNRAMRRLAMAGVEVWDRGVAERVTRVRLQDMSRFYQEVVRPGRLEGQLAMAHSLKQGRAMLHVLPERPGETAFRGDGIEVLRFLLPAFKAGTEAVTLSVARWRGLARSLDVLDEGVALYRNGTECYRNRALRRLLGPEQRPEAVLAAAQQCAARLTRRIGRPTGAVGEPYVSARVVTRQNLYRLRACHMEGGSEGRPAVIMVVVQPASPPLPDKAELCERYGLTPRESQVALLLARGRSSREISELLAISPHTARHHAEHVLGKIGASGRKAIALRLLADREP